MKQDRARQILEQLILEVRNPDVANHMAAMRACMDAEKLFAEEGHEIQESGAEAQAGGEDEAGPSRPKGVRGRPKGNRKRAASGATSPDPIATP